MRLNKGLSIKRYTEGKVIGYEVSGYLTKKNKNGKLVRIRKRFKGPNAEESARGYRTKLETEDQTGVKDNSYRSTTLSQETEYAVNALIRRIREDLNDTTTPDHQLIERAVKFFLECPLRTIPDLTVKEAVIKFRERKNYKSLATRTKEGYYSNFRFLLGEIGNRQIATITEIEMQKLIDLRHETSFHQRQAAFRAWRAFWNWAVKQRYCNENIVERCDFPKKEKGRDNIECLSAEQFGKLLFYADKVNGKKMIPYLVLGAFCALRPYEIQRASWDDIIWEENDSEYLSTIQAKQRKGDTFNRNVEIPREAIAWLEYYDPNVRDRTGPICNANFHKHLCLIKACAGFRMVKGNIGSMKYYGLDEHVADCDADGRPEWISDFLRHTGITFRLKKGDLSKSEVAEWAGNSPTIIDTNYKAVVGGTKRESDLFWAVTPESVFGS